VSLDSILPSAPCSLNRSDCGRRFGRLRLWSGDHFFAGVSFPTQTSDSGRVWVTDHIARLLSRHASRTPFLSYAKYRFHPPLSISLHYQYATILHFPYPYIINTLPSSTFHILTLSIHYWFHPHINGLFLHIYIFPSY